MKHFLRFLKAIPAVLARIAHVIEHIFCDEVPFFAFGSLVITSNI